MLLKRMDETITQGLYDLDAGPQEVDAYVAEPSMGDGVIHWEIAASGMVPRSLLHYDDTPDASVKFNSSWRDFYASGAAFGERPLYSGSSTFFGGGKPNFGGVAKAAIYLRYSAGFLNWLEAFDPETAARLREEIPAFEAMMENARTKKLPAVWHKFKAPRDQWPLVSICRLSSGKQLVLWLLADGQLDRAALGAVVFGNSKELERLNGIVFPAVTLAVEERIAACTARGLVVDAINLIECGLGARCDVTVAITAPPEMRLRRIMARDGIGEAYARRRIEAQKKDSYYRKHCDFLLENRAGSQEEFARLIREFFEDFLLTLEE